MKQLLRKILSKIYIIRTLIFTIYNKGYKCILQQIILRIFRRVSIRSGKVVCDNFIGLGYGDNPKFIVEELIKRGEDLDIVWLLRPEVQSEFPQYVRTVKINSIRALYELSSAEIIIDNIRNFHPVKKKEGQIYLQTWHGGVALKKIEAEIEDMLSVSYIRDAKYDGSVIDGILADSEMQARQFKRSFWLGEKAEVLMVGLPRNDILIQSHKDDKKISRLKLEYHFDADGYYVLYAPTFRDDRSLDGYLFDFEPIVEAFSEKMKQTVYVIIRFHPNVASHDSSMVYNDHILNGTRYLDVQELSLICDCVISDYSSIVFDYAIMKKPVFICALDEKRYNETRGLTDEFYSMPFPITYSIEGLIKSILDFDGTNYGRAVDEYLAQHPFFDNGDASAKTVDWLMLKRKMRKNIK